MADLCVNSGKAEDSNVINPSLQEDSNVLNPSLQEDSNVINPSLQQEDLTPISMANTTSSSSNTTMHISTSTCSVAVSVYNGTNGPVSVSTISALPVVYEFYIPQGIVGRLIGRFGSFVHQINKTTGANILIKRHPTSSSHKICAIEGLPQNVQSAIEMIKGRFPPKRFPQLSLDQVNQGHVPPPPVPILPPNNKLLLIEGVSSDVIVSNVTSLSDIFLQHPCHPTYPAMAKLQDALVSFYEEAVGVPHLLRPFNVGVICVARVHPKWFRAEVVEVDEEKEKVKVKLLDVGGYHQVPMKNLRQIRVDFLSTPFQATECGLANVYPLDKGAGWSNEAIHHFKYLSSNHVLRAFVVGYDVDNDRTLVHLFKINGNQPPVLINKELADYGLVKWGSTDMDTFPTTEV